MEKIAPINPANQYKYMQNFKQRQDNQQGDQPQSTQREDKDTYEKQEYSPYTMYNNKGQLYNNCIARRIISKCSNFSS